MSSPSIRRATGSPARWLTIATGVALLLALAIYISLEGNLTEGFLDLREWFGGFVRRFGASGSLALLYVEESGLPLPVPGDVYVAYLGHLSAGSSGSSSTPWRGSSTSSRRVSRRPRPGSTAGAC